MISWTQKHSKQLDQLSFVSIRGVWNVPFVSEAVLLNGSLIQKVPISYEDSYLDAVLQFASNLREKDIFMYGTNMDYFGHLVNPDGFNTSLVRPEMYEIFNNLEVRCCCLLGKVHLSIFILMFAASGLGQ